jgi:hypothetical protein
MNTRKLFAFVLALALGISGCTLPLTSGGGVLSLMEEAVLKSSAGSGARLYGHIEFEHWREGVLLARHETPNLVVDAGKAATAGLINGVVTNFFEHIAIGTGATAAAAGDTACQTEITTNGGQRAAGTTSRVTTDVTNDTAQVVLTYNFTGSFAITESCLLDSITTGTLLARQVFSAINVVNGDSLQVTWKIDVD